MNTLNIVVTAAGGLGLFLLGLVIMTDALRALAGDVIRRVLMRFTRSPLTGAITGAATTAALQSSSATTVTAVGFVSAGLLTFSQSLGIIFGANIGSTATGWIVALLGFKLNLGTVVLPLILLGILLRLFAKGRLAKFGLAIAGFGLIFVGIGTMQEAVKGLQSGILLFDIPADTALGRLQLIAIGILFTVVTQASSAGVAATLTAVYAGNVNFEQAAALVIGMDIGTTITAAMATLGGSVATRRTGLSHVFYNLMTGIGATLFITPYIWIWESLSPGALLANAEIALVAFHTTFNTLGVIIVLPFASAFARMMKRLIPDQRIELTRGLDTALLKEPGVAITAIHSVLRQETIALLLYLKWMLGPGQEQRPYRLMEINLALEETQAYTDNIHLGEEKGRNWHRLYAIAHALDHMHRLYNRFRDEERQAIARKTSLMSELKMLLGNNLSVLIADIEGGEWDKASQLAQEMSTSMDRQTDTLRDQVMGMVASDAMDVPLANDYLKTLRWLNRISTHVARMIHYLQQAAETLEQPVTQETAS